MGRYCRGVQAIVYVVDAADHDALQVELGRQQQGMVNSNDIGKSSSGGGGGGLG
jgi:hypothetical protein